MYFVKNVSGVSKIWCWLKILNWCSCKVSGDHIAKKSSPDNNASKCIIVSFLLFFCYTLLNDRLRENKAQNFRYKKILGQIDAFWFFGQKWLFGQKYFCQIWNGFLARNGFLRQFIFWQENFIRIMLLSNESALLLKVLKGLARL